MSWISTNRHDSERAAAVAAIDRYAGSPPGSLPAGVAGAGRLVACAVRAVLEEDDLNEVAALSTLQCLVAVTRQDADPDARAAHQAARRLLGALDRDGVDPSDEPASTRAPASGSGDPDALGQLAELSAGMRIAALVSRDGDGRLHSRPVTVLAGPEDGSFWFLVDAESDWVRRLARDGEVNLSLANPDDGTWVSIAGLAAVTDDRQRIEALWAPPARAWFDGVDDPRLRALQVEVVSYAWWDSSSSTVARISRVLLAAVGAGTSTGDHGARAV